MKVSSVPLLSSPNKISGSYDAPSTLPSMETKGQTGKGFACVPGERDEENVDTLKR